MPRFRPALLAAALVIPRPALAAPSVELIYDARRDHDCAADRGYVVEEAWVAELEAVLPGLRTRWQRLAPALFAAVSTLTGRPTQDFVVPVALTLCDTPSQSFSGPSVNMRFALRSFTAQPVALRYKLDTAFHESLHAFTRRFVPRHSALLAGHGAESACVRNHLHLLSLQKAALLFLGEDAALAQVVDTDSRLPSGCYQRAWAIVNEGPDTYRGYVDELTGEP